LHANMRICMVLCMVWCTTAQQHLEQHLDHTLHSRRGPGEDFQEALTTCKSDSDSLCPSESSMRGKLRCLGIHASELSADCRTGLLNAIRQRDQGGRPQGHAGTSGPTQTQLKQCMPGIMKTCEPQVIELMTNPLDTDGADLVECAKAHSSTIGGVCEKLVERLTKDGFAEQVIGCGQKFLGLCPAESVGLIASSASSQMNMKAVQALGLCLGKKKAEIAGTCTLISDALASNNDSTDEGYADGYGESSSSQIDGFPHDDMDHKPHGGSALGMIVAFMGICTCATFAGVVFWKRGEIVGMMQPRAHPPTGYNFQQMDEEQGTALAGTTIATSEPPRYPHDANVKIVTATPIG